MIHSNKNNVTSIISNNVFNYGKQKLQKYIYIYITLILIALLKSQKQNDPYYFCGRNQIAAPKGYAYL